MPGPDRNEHEDEDGRGGDDSYGGGDHGDRLVALQRHVTELAGEVAGFERDLDVLGRIVGHLTRQRATPDEVVTRRLRIVDEQGAPRMVAEVVGGTVELRLEVPGAEPGRRSAVVLHASRAPDGSDEAPLTPLLGLQLWADGDVVAELDAWSDDDGRWRPHLHLSGES
ncbi:MAG: hypothetical protein ACRDYZ_14790 [Acidimicrobiales bacterium]